MFAKVNSVGLSGLDGYAVEVECDVQNGLPGFIMTGVLSTETREAQSRVWNALRNSGFRAEPKKITVNLSPASVKKWGTSYDLAVAVAVMCGYGMADHNVFKSAAFFGETGLDGSLKGVKGALPLAFGAREAGFSMLVVADENLKEASLVDGIQVIGCSSINEVMELIRKITGGGEVERTAFPEDEEGGDCGYEADFKDVRGQEYLKRAAEIAVSGMHNILFTGPAGTGKTMIAKCMPSIMPELTREEDIEISKIYSICGLLPEGRPLLSKRPFRSPHHGITEAAFAGGGNRAVPGEMSLASGGILFLDEMPLFSRNVLEMLRQPLEDRTITVTRVHGNYIYPADFMLVGAMNACPCGFYPDRRKCHCTPAQIRAYMGRLSRPLMERIDICAEANPLKIDELVDKGSEERESSAVIRKRVERARQIQKERFGGAEPRYNSHMSIKEIEEYCHLGKTETDFVREIFRKKGLSGRTYHKVLKVARTIADCAQEEKISVEHIAEAVEFRSYEDRLYGNDM